MKGKDLTHCIKYFLGIENAHTQTVPAEQILMRKYTSSASNIVEIGIFEGFNTREFALNSPKSATIYAIDPFFKGKLGLSYGKMIATKEWAKHDVSAKIRLIEGFSWDVIDKIPNNIDFVFIDGDHTLEGVKKDFEMYSTKLSKHGVIALHDARLFTNGWTQNDWGPVRLVEEYIKKSNEWEVIEEEASLVIVKRR